MNDTVRFSLGRTTTWDELERVLAHLDPGPGRRRVTASRHQAHRASHSRSHASFARARRRRRLQRDDRHRIAEEVTVTARRDVRRPSRPSTRPSRRRRAGRGGAGDLGRDGARDDLRLAAPRTSPPSGAASPSSAGSRSRPRLPTPARTGCGASRDPPGSTSSPPMRPASRTARGARCGRDGREQVVRRLGAAREPQAPPPRRRRAPSDDPGGTRSPSPPGGHECAAETVGPATPIGAGSAA